MILVPFNAFDVCILFQSDHDPNFEHAHECSGLNISTTAAEWAARAADVARETIWDDTQVISSNDTNEVTRFTQHYVEPGGMIRVLLDNDTLLLWVDYISASDPHDPALVMQEAVCQMISYCDVDYGYIISLLQRRSDLNLNYIELEISKDVPTALKGRQTVDFELRVKNIYDEDRVDYYILDMTRQSTKRSKEYTSYSNWSTTSIPDEYYFPSYRQHWVSPDCPVGSGPVAWAVVFGYYDRRSHMLSAKYGNSSWDLYRCGIDGTTGSNGCVAPMHSPKNDKRLRNYVEHIAKVLGG